ncbi:MAG: hypothetical protein IPJ98_19090 [Bryobacterales bacterium]|nr:hypothetical protein [Bryobacterales bacterium]
MEDDASVRNTIVTFLELEGYQVEAVSTTHEALEKLGGGGYPIVLSDIYLDERPGSTCWPRHARPIRAAR